MWKFENVSETFDTSGGFPISNTVLRIYIWVVYIFLCEAINIFGIVTNIINIACFVKQGFHESVNVSLFGLSLSDLASLLTMTFICIFMCPDFATADLNFENYDISYLVFVTPHFAFTRVSSCITAMVAMERCLSIACPLQIKSIATPKKTAALVVCIFLIFTCSSAPVYVVNKLSLQFSTSRNKTVLGLLFSSNRDQVEQVALSINNLIIPFGAFVLIIICTTILLFQLHKSMAWRKTNVTGVQAEKVSSRNTVVAKMVLLISLLYIVCFVPSTTIMFAMAFEPSLFINGKNIHLTEILCGFIFIMESLNSSMNIFIYHKMSSNYRDAFRKIFWRNKNSSRLTFCKFKRKDY